MTSLEGASLCVVIPCHNEEISVASVVEEYHEAFPGADILVIDNASTDQTAARAEAAGAVVLRENRKGKGWAILSALCEVDHDLVIMVDGDGSYPAEGARNLLKAFQESPSDMITGVRCAEMDEKATFRPLHQAGTSAFGRVLELAFGFRSSDLFSGLRLFSRRFCEQIPILSRGFELELELTVQAIDKGFSMIEVPVPFRARAEGTVSKLRTVQDGLRIARFLLVLFRDYKPLIFFGAVGAMFLVLGTLAGIAPIWEYFQTGLVGRFPLAFLAASLMILAFMSFQTGLSLESSLRYQRESFQCRMRRSQSIFSVRERFSARDV